MTKRGIFIAATGQNVGKTTLCLGLVSSLKKRFSRLGFMKPVGQRHVLVDQHHAIDKDVVLFKQYFDLKDDYQDMSPVICPSGFTKDYLDGRWSTADLEEKIIASFRTIYEKSDYTIVEGTGHVGVGSIVCLNNAKVAAMLGLDMVIIASGGLGSSFDELALNISMCAQYGVNVRGIILNRVLNNKREMIQTYFPKALAESGIPLIGCVPFSNLLSLPAIQDFELLFDTKLLAGKKYRFRHLDRKRLVAESKESFEKDVQPNELVITPACRDDIIHAFLNKHLESDFGGGMILTGEKAPSEEILKKIGQVDIPVLYAPICSYDAMKKITHFIAKIRMEDSSKVERAINLVEQHVDLDALCRQEVLAP